METITSNNKKGGNMENLAILESCKNLLKQNNLHKCDRMVISAVLDLAKKEIQKGAK